MTQFIIIRPGEKSCERHQFDDLDGARKAAGLDKVGVDFGSLTPRHGIVVYELGLLKGNPTEYFSIGSALFNGGAVIFATDETGETVDISSHELAAVLRNLKFYDSVEDVERAIEARYVRRPQQSINGVVCWEWNKQKDGDNR